MALLQESRPRRSAQHWPSASDDALVRGATAGTDGAFDEIFARYHAPLVRHCRGILLDDDSAQDAAQNALANALRALQSGGSAPRSLRPWLYRIAQREAAEIGRRRRGEAAARQLSGADGQDALLSVPAPSDERVRDRLRELVGDLRRLPLRQRSALLLRELSGLAYADIAVALDTTPAAARQSVLEARTALGEVTAGRNESCGAVRALVDAGDRRRLRGRRIGAHLDDCPGCRAFAARIADRRRDLALLFPLAPAALASSSGALAAVTGGGVAAGGAGVAAGGWTPGLGGIGASGAAKCAIACTAILGVGAIGEQVVTRPHRAPVEVVAQAPQPVGHGSSSTGSRGPARAVAVVAPAAKATSSSGTAARTRRTVRVKALRPDPAPQAAAGGSAAGGLGGTAKAPATSSPAKHAPAKQPPAQAVTPPAPAPAPAPSVPTAPTTAPVAASPTRQQLLAAELKRRTQQAILDAANAASTTNSTIVQQVTQLSTTTAQRLLAAAQTTTTQITTTRLGGVQTVLQRILQPRS